MSISTPGLLLQVIPYLGKKKILKVFTPEMGLVSLFAQTTCLTPFSLAEWVFLTKQKEIHSLQDTKLIDPFLHLKEDYKILSAAGAIAQDLLRTQLPNKKAVNLFNLTLFYFKNLSISPELLAASFKLKLLVAEGLLSSDFESSFTQIEWDQVTILAFSRSLSAIQNVGIAPHSKIKLLFEERLS